MFFFGIYLNILVVFLGGSIALSVFSKIRRLREIRERSYSKGLDYFLLTFGILWISVAIRNLFFVLRYPEWDRWFWAWVTGPLTYFHILPLFFFFGWAFFKDRRGLNLAFKGFFSLAIILAVAFLFLFGFETVATEWGTKHDANPYTDAVFTFAVYLPILILVICFLVQRFMIWGKTHALFDRQMFGFAIGFLVYALIAVLDGLALVVGYGLILVRIAGTLLPSLIFYYYVTEEMK